MEKVDYMISLEELFKRDKFQISDLVKALNIDEGDEIINRLFLFLNANNLISISIIWLILYPQYAIIWYVMQNKKGERV